MRVDEFLRANVEEYLFRDLRTMLRAAPNGWNNGGGVGYPLVMTCFAGIELLGELLLDGDFPDRGSQERAFAHYWTKYLYPRLSNTAEIGSTLYKLARHGIAHVFVLKGPLKVAFDAPGYHLTLDTDGCVTINAKELADDFITSYEASIRPMAQAGATSATFTQMQRRLDGMEHSYEAQARSKGQFTAFARAPGPPLRRVASSEAPIQGATGPTFADSKAVSATWAVPIWRSPSGK